MKIHMVASKRMKYGTRMLNAGDPFEAKSSDVRILEAIKKASRAPVTAKPEPAPVVSEAPTEEAPPRRRGRPRRTTEPPAEETSPVEGTE